MESHALLHDAIKVLEDPLHTSRPRLNARLLRGILVLWMGSGRLSDARGDVLRRGVLLVECRETGRGCIIVVVVWRIVGEGATGLTLSQRMDILKDYGNEVVAKGSSPPSRAVSCIGRGRG